MNDQKGDILNLGNQFLSSTANFVDVNQLQLEQPLPPWVQKYSSS